MIINDLYYPTIKLNKYDASVGEDGILVTVKLFDFNKKAVTDKPIQLECDKGYFTKQKNIIITDKRKVINDKSDSKGELTATYKASEFGLATFIVNNDAKIQLLVLNTQELKVTNEDSSTSSYTIITK